MPTGIKPRAKKPKEKEGEVAQALDRYRMLRWFAVASMLAIASWIVIALFGPVPRYQLAHPPTGPLDSQQFVNEVEALSGSRIDPHTHIEELPNGRLFYESEIRAVQGAQKSIDWEAYIFQKGEIAQRIVDALTDRARAGVEVNLVLDGVGSLTTPKKFFDPLRLAGGHVAWYHPVRWYNWPRVNNRTHRELIVIDGRLAFIGGAGVADHWWHGEKDD
ncbi:MAG: phospholipase D-like domain-containing protein, partial [Candidatus Angelobacter sp.]